MRAVQALSAQAARCQPGRPAVLTADQVAVGDMLMRDGYPVEVRQKMLSPDGQVCTLAWGEARGEMIIVLTATPLSVVVGVCYAGAVWHER